MNEGLISPRVFADDDRLGRVRGFVQQHLDRPIHLNDVAAVAHLEPKYFSFYFRTKTGVRFSDWLTACRVEAARRMLSESKLSVWQIADRVGMDERTFRRAFKRYTRLSASLYRERFPVQPVRPQPFYMFTTDHDDADRRENVADSIHEGATESPADWIVRMTPMKHER